MTYIATKQRVLDRGVPPDSFLDEMIIWGKYAPADIFISPGSSNDIYVNVLPYLGPFEGLSHRRAVMLEVMRVLAGFESSWKWSDGRDISNPRSYTTATTEAGAWQVSSDSLNFGQELKNLVRSKAGALDGNTFQKAMKTNHPLAMEYIARLLRRTIRHNGPIRDRHIHKWLRKDAVAEFQTLVG
jgi:hypothetical protein